MLAGKLLSPSRLEQVAQSDRQARLSEKLVA